MPVILKTAGLLILSNTFMTFAWYAHLRNLSGRKWYIAALASWGIAFFEYMLQVPANRIGYTQLNLGQLKILQEVITLSVFVPFAFFYMQQPLKLNYLWAGICMVGAVILFSGDNGFYDRFSTALVSPARRTTNREGRLTSIAPGNQNHPGTERHPQQEGCTLTAATG